jgi:2-hydroxy-6-oxonona-2,4-dienedioate hydrolase
MLVLVHGLGVSGRYFRPLVRELEGVETVVPDLRRFASLEAQAEALSESVGTGTAVLANSYGCQIVAELALRHPALVGRTVFVGPTVDRRHRSFWQQGGRLLLDATMERPSLVPLALRDALEAGPRRVARMARSALRDALEGKLSALKAPLLVVRGGRDPLCQQDWAEELVRLAPRARLEVIPHGAHAVHHSHPAELARLVRRFLEEPD